MCTSDKEKKYCEFLERYGFFDVDDFSLFEKAMRHTSYIYEANIPIECSYERLEFLGDAVLKLATSNYLYKKYPDFKEGVLSKIRSEIVADKTLAIWAKKIGLNGFILMSKNERKMGGELKPSILACAFEAFLGALFLTYKEDFSRVNNFILENFTSEMQEIEDNIDKINPKQKLQEYTQSVDHSLPEYKVLSKTGSEHKSLFKIGVYFKGELLAVGSGYSKKNAQQDAARLALIEIEKGKNE